jgi:hypothetical protein
VTFFGVADYRPKSKKVGAAGRNILQKVFRNRQNV